MQMGKLFSKVALLVVLSAVPAFASVSGDEAQLVGTTVPGHPAHAVGHIDVTAPGVLTFRTSAASGASTQELTMPYDQVFEFGLTSEDAFHLGFFPAMFYGMVAPRPKRHVFTVSWHSADGVAQEATFEVSKQFSQHLLQVLYARARGACVRREFGACTPVVAPPLPPRIPLTPAASQVAAPTPALSGPAAP